MRRAIELMKRCEEEILNTLTTISKRTNEFMNPELMVIGGYALRAYISLSRYTRDCDFALMKKNGWNIDKLKDTLPEGYLIDEIQKHENYGFLKCTKLIKHGKTKIKVSIDFMEGEIRGREPGEIIVIDDNMIKNRIFKSIPIANSSIKLPFPTYVDYFIMKIVSARAIDVRDIASLILENGVPENLSKRIMEILPHPSIFLIKLKNKVLPEIRKSTFINSWRGVFGTSRYSEEDKNRVIAKLEELLEDLGNL
jgi:hypothetical protein